MNIDPNTTKYLIKARLTADGIVEKPDVVGAIFGQTEGLLGEELDLRDLQKSGRIGRIEVDVTSKSGKSDGLVYISSSLDQVETAILASALETIDRVGPCKAGIKVLGIEDVRISKREKVIDRAKELLNDLIKQSKGTSVDITENVRQSIQVEEITTFGPDKCPAGPNVKDSEAIIIVEGRSDVLNLLRSGIKNAIAVEGTNIPKTVQDLSKEKVTTAFTDGDRGGELILRELFQTADIDFVARAPRAHEVEELTTKQIIKCLRNKVPGDQYMEMNGLSEGNNDEEPRKERREDRREERNGRDREDRREDRNGRDRDDRNGRRDDRKGREDRREERKPRFDADAAEKFKKRSRDEDEGEKEESEPQESRPEPKEERELRKRDDDKPKGRVKKEVVKAPKVLSPEQEKYKELLLGMASTHNAKVLNSDGDVVREIAVKSLVDSLKEDPAGANVIVFDGVISQRILDVSSENNITTVVGTRKGNISKMPAGISIWTKEDLC